MQTDAWLTETSYLDCCPLCSQPLAGNSNICSACGFTAHEAARTSLSASRQPAAGSLSRRSNPITPVPPRASARHPHSAPGEPARHDSASKSGGSSASAGSRTQRAGWRHHSPRYEAASSLSSLSLIISETPTAPPRATRQLSDQVGNAQHIDEIDTRPPSFDYNAAMLPTHPETAPDSISLRRAKSATPNPAQSATRTSSLASLPGIDEIDTQPERSEASARVIVPASLTAQKFSVDAASWTLAPTDHSAATDSCRGQRSYPRSFHLLDRWRWWILRPGRIEFLLWLLGSLLLFSLTFLLLLASVFSTTLPERQASGNLPISATSNLAATATTPAVASDLRLALHSTASLAPGAQIQIQGQGFRPHSKVIFLLDNRWPLLDQQQQAAWTRADVAGRFSVTLWLGQGPDWSPGSHQLLAREMNTGHQVTLSITITPLSSTPVAGHPGPYKTPPAHPTPTPHHPTPTPGPSTPGPTATTEVIPTPSPSPISTATASQGQNASNLGNELNNHDGSSPFARLAHLNPLIWLIAACYFLSMLLLGIAGILHRSRPARK